MMPPGSQSPVPGVGHFNRALLGHFSVAAKLVASGLSPYGGLYRVLSAPACGNRWGPSMDNLLPMRERKLSLPRKARSPLPGPPFSPFGWPGSRKARLHELLSAWRMFQTGSSEDVNVAPLRMSNN